MSDEETQGGTATQESADTASTESSADEAPAWAQEIRGQMDQLVSSVAPQAETTNPYYDVMGLNTDPNVPVAPQAETPVAPDPGFQQAPPVQQPQYGDQQYQQQPSQHPMGPDGEMIEGWVQKQAQEAAREMVTPYMQRLEQERRQSDAVALTEDYPELKDPDTAQRVVGEAQQWANALGNPAMAQEPAFVELVINAGRSLASAQSETPASGTDGVSLESPSAGNPGAGFTESAEQRAQEIVDAGKRTTPQAKFWLG